MANEEVNPFAKYFTKPYEAEPAPAEQEENPFAKYFTKPYGAEPVQEKRPYRDRREALDDAVLLLEEGHDPEKVINSFGDIGISKQEIAQHGTNKNSFFFAQKPVIPPVAPVAPGAPQAELKETQPTTVPISFFGTTYQFEPEAVANVFKRAKTNFQDMATSLLHSTGAITSKDAAFLLADNARKRAAAAPSKDIQEGLEAIGNAKVYGDAALEMLKNPKATLSMLVDSILVTAPSMVTLGASSALARAGLQFAASSSMEYTSVLADVLADHNIDITDTQNVAKALDNPKIQKELKEVGAKRGLIVGAFDALTAGLAGRFMKPVNEAIAAGKLAGAKARQAAVGSWAKELAMQAAGGSGGELLAQKAVGQNKPAEVWAEGLAEAFTAPLDVRAALRETAALEKARLAREEALRNLPALPPEVRPIVQEAPILGKALEPGTPPEEEVALPPEVPPEAVAEAPPAEAAVPEETAAPPVEAPPVAPTAVEAVTEEPEAPPVPEAIVPEAPVTPVTPPQAEEVAPAVSPVPPTKAAEALPETPTVAPEKNPKIFEPAAPQHKTANYEDADVPVKDLRLSMEVPQFKLGASSKGIVDPLEGTFTQEGVAPIAVWRRINGDLEVISGRHRFDLAQRSGTKTIKSQIYDEASGFTSLDAAIKDAELNIRDNQGEIKDYVNYFKNIGIDRETAQSRGLLAREKGKRGFAIANQGSDSLISALNSNQVGPEAAFYIALNAPNDERLQNVGIKAIRENKSVNAATNLIQAVKALAGEQDTTTDMFGFDDSAMREAEEMAKIAASKQRALGDRISAISGAAKNPKLARAEGIDIKDPEAVLLRIEQLRAEKAAWDNWSTNPYLISEIRAERGTPAPKLAAAEEPEVEAPAGPSLFEEAPLLTAPTPKELKAKTETEAANKRKKAEEERKEAIDEERKQFLLTGSERAADEAAARGQTPLLAIEPTKEKESKKTTALIRESIRAARIKQYAAWRRALGKIAKDVSEGKASITMQRNATRLLKQSRLLKSVINATKPVKDSPEQFFAKALKEYDAGNLSKDVLDVIKAAYNKDPSLLSGISLSVTKAPPGKEGVAAEFKPLERIIVLYKGTGGISDPVSVRHELEHSLEQMMTPEQKIVLVNEWWKALNKVVKQNPDEQHQKFFDAIVNFLNDPKKENYIKAKELMPNYGLYQFLNPSEYWAVNSENLMAAHLGSAWEKFKQAVRKLFEGLKKVFGFDNKYYVHKIFDQVMRGSKERISHDMLVNMAIGEGKPTTIANIQDDQKLIDKHKRPRTPMLDTTPIKTFLTRQYKNGKEFFVDALKNPKEAMVGTGDSVMDGVTALRVKGVWYGAGLESRDFERYGGQLRASNGLVTASVALDNAIRSGNIATEVVFRGGIKFDPKSGNFVAVERDLGMKGVYKAEAKLKKKLGDQLGTDIIQGYLEAKRSISIMDELYKRESELKDAKKNLENLKQIKADTKDIQAAKTNMESLENDLDAINKAASSVNMSKEEMYEFAELDKKHSELEDIMKNWTAVNQNLLYFWRQVGLLSEGRYDTLSAIKDYVPWYRIMNDEEDVHSSLQSTTRTLTNIGREKLFKRGRPVSIVDFRAKQGQKDFKIQPSSVVKVEVNGKKISQNLLSVTRNGEVHINMDLDENDLVVFKTNREIENIVDNMTRNVMRMTMNGIRQYAANRVVMEYGSRNADNKIMTFPRVDKEKGRLNWVVNGKKVVVEIQDPLVAASIYGMESINLQMIKPIAMMANLVRRSITLSGVFQVKQVFKDAPTAALVTGVKNPIALIGGVWKGFLTSLVQPALKAGGVDIEPTINILKAAGIGGFHSPARTPEAEIKRRIGIMNSNVFSAIIKTLDHIGDSSDIAQRVATYKRVMAETGDEAQALYQAANVINFLHHGSSGYAQGAVKLVPFMGAYANSMDVLINSLAGGGLKGMSRKKAIARLGVTAGLLSGMTLLYCMLAGADPDYDELDDQTKLKNIMIPGTKIMLPMNTSAALIFKAIPELIYDWVTKEGTEKAYDKRRLKAALANAARDMLLGPEPIPAGFKPLIEVSINHDFFTGRTVIPESLKDVEAAERYTASTSELGKMLSAMLVIPGTDGKRVLSPISADHIIRGMFGTAGATAQWIVNSIAASTESRLPPSVRETPITGAFLREEAPRGREELFYDFKEIVFEKYKTWQKMIDRGDYDAAEKYLDKNVDISGMYAYINRTEDKLKKVNNYIRWLSESKDTGMTPSERVDEISKMKKVKIEILEPVKELRRESIK